jgi:hypothetical protein
MRGIHVATVVLSSIVLIGCAPIRVSTFVERGVDFAQFHTYDWAPAAPFATGDPRLDNNPFFTGHLQSAVEEGLAAKGLRKTTSSTPDVWIRYHASMSQSFAVAGVDRYGNCGTRNDCEARVIDYEAGTLVVDVTDAQTNRLVWRGSAQQSVDALIDNQDWMEQYVEKSVTAMMGRFPAIAASAESAARND